MHKYIIYSDLHIGGPHEIKPGLKFGKKVVFLGDNFDIKNTKIARLNNLSNFRKKVISKVKKSGGIYLAGNHSLEPVHKYYEVRDSVLFSHGDVFENGIHKAKKWRKSNKPGKSFVYWYFLKLVKKIVGNVSPKFNYYESERIIKASWLHKYKTIVIGHYHPRKVKEFNIAGTKVICVPRGKTILYL